VGIAEGQSGAQTVAGPCDANGFGDFFH
jgi:hypothetical protein